VKHHDRRPAWIGPFRAAGRAVLGAYPVEFRETLGAELLDASEERVLERRVERGGTAAMAFALAELTTLAVAAIEARRRLCPAIERGPRVWGTIDVPGRLRSMVTDVTDAARGIRRAPGPAVMVVLMIGLGVGLTTSVFSVVDGVLLEPLPFQRSDDLVHVWANRAWQNEPRGLIADVQLKDLREKSRSIEGLSALWMVSGRILGGERPVHTDVARVSFEFFDLLGVEAHLGRTFREGEDRPGAPWVAILEYDYWLREFGGDPDVIGRRVVVGWQEMEVIGVLPREFHFRIPPELGAHENPDVWIPWWHRYAENGRAAGGTLAVVGRIAGGATLADVQQELDMLARAEDQSHYDGLGFGFNVERLQDGWVGDVRPAILIFAGAVVLVLIITIANAAALLLARNQVRHRELGVRQALGASRLQIARLLVAESLLLTLAGGALGVVLAASGTKGLLAVAPPGLPRMDAVDVEGHVLAFALVASILSGLAAVMASLMRARRVDPDSTLRGSRGHITDSTGTRRAQSALVVAQVAFSVVLLVGAGLFIRTFLHVQSADLGFQEEDRLTFSVYLMDEYSSHESHIGFYRSLRERIAEIPGVRSVSGTSALPLSDGAPQIPASTFARDRDVDPTSFFLTEGFSVLFADRLEAVEGDGWTLVDITAVQAGYFGAAGIPLLEGRGVVPEDRPGETLRMVVDRGLAERFWTVETAVGQRLWIAGAWREIVGVVNVARMAGLREVERPQAYLPHSQVRSGRVSMVVHTDGDATAVLPGIRRAVTDLDPLVPSADIRTMESIVGEATARDRFSMLLMSLFAGTAMVMVAMGVYGVLSFSVRERLREMALRMTVGMGKTQLAAMVVAEGFRPTTLGLAIGLVAAFALSRATRSLLYGVGPHDPVTLAGVSALIAGVSLVACWRPAVRAASLDAAETLGAD
jgi:predicted permease